MSGVFGVMRLDGGEVSAVSLNRMAAALAHRALDGGAAEAFGEVGLGACLTQLRPVDRHEAQPLHDADDDLTLVADTRLDDRADLALALGLSIDNIDSTPDSTLILAAYRAWGDRCAERLLGDFVFAIWDGRARRLLIARDHMGQRDLHYHVGDGFFAFAPEPVGLFALPDVPRDLDDDAIGARLLGERPGIGRRGPFVGLNALPGGHLLTIGARGDLEIRRYWTPAAAAEHIGHDEAYYVAAYRRVLGEATACRVRGLIQRPGLLLSGGYDSAAIAGLAGPALAPGQKLVTASSVMPADYRGTIRHARHWAELCTRDMPWLDPHYVTREGVDALTGLETALAETQTPRNAYGFVHDALQSALAAGGARLAMDGHGGDYTLNPRGDGALARFWKTGPLSRFLSELRAHIRLTGRSLYHTVKVDLLPHLALRLLPGEWRAKPPAWAEKAISPAFAADLFARGAVQSASLRAAPRDRTAMHERITETIDRISANPGGSGGWLRHGLVISRPFHDKRVVELALAIPEDLYVAEGRNRYLACRALADVYPPEFQARWRRNDDQIPDFQMMVSRIKPRLLADVARMERSERLSRIFDFAAIRRLLDVRGPDDHNSGWEEESQTALSAYMLARFVDSVRRENPHQDNEPIRSHEEAANG